MCCTRGVAGALVSAFAWGVAIWDLCLDRLYESGLSAAFYTFHDRISSLKVRDRGTL